MIQNTLFHNDQLHLSINKFLNQFTFLDDTEKMLQMLVECFCRSASCADDSLRFVSRFASDSDEAGRADFSLALMSFLETVDGFPHLTMEDD